MTKGQIIELIKGYLSGESTTQDMMHKVDARRLELYIDAAFRDVIYEVYKTNQAGLSEYAKKYDGIAVSLDGVTGAYTSVLPAAILQLPGTASGIRRISLDAGTKLEFVPVDAEIAESISMLDVSDVNINDVIGYYPRDNKLVEFLNFPVAYAAETLRMDLVIPFTEYAASDEVSIPSGQNFNLITAVVKLLTGREPVDLKNDNREKETK